MPPGLPPAGGGADGEALAQISAARDSFRAAMDDDLNTADALGVLFELARACNTFVSEPRGEKAVNAARALFSELTGVLGLLIQNKEEEAPKEALDLLSSGSRHAPPRIGHARIKYATPSRKWAMR